MKKIMILVLVASFASLYFSCNEDRGLVPMQDEEMLIEQITNAPIVEAVGVRDLPSAISTYVKENHAPSEIDLVFRAGQHGYEVFMENGLCIYFDQNGNHLNHDGMHGDMGNHHGGGDPGINFCLAGDTLDIADLPQSALDYITANYPGASVTTIVVKPGGNLAVELSTGDILMFAVGGNYFHECDMQATGGHGHEHGNTGGPGWHCGPDGNMGGGHGGTMGHGNHGGMDNHSSQGESCWGGSSITIDDLPSAITIYINTNHTDSAIIHAMQTFNGNYFLRLSDCARLVFDEDGNILFDTGG